VRCMPVKAAVTPPCYAGMETPFFVDDGGKTAKIRFFQLNPLQSG